MTLDQLKKTMFTKPGEAMEKVEVKAPERPLKSNFNAKKPPPLNHPTTWDQKPGGNELWVDKYKPKVIGDLVGNKSVIMNFTKWL